VPNDVPIKAILVRFPFSPDALGVFREIKGRQWDPALKAWSVPYTPSSVDALIRFIERFASDTPDVAPNSDTSTTRIFPQVDGI
jgi:hypothetical protein